MKLKVLASFALIASITIPVHAGDAKDMKEIAPITAPVSDASFYVAIYGGANFSQDTGNGKSVYNDPAHPSNPITTNSDANDVLGGVGGLKLGYKFESTDLGGGFALQPAVEGEVYYLGTQLKLRDTQGTQFYGVTKTTSRADVNSVAFMANGILNFKTPSIVTPYIGAGIGGEYISITSKSFNDHIFGGGVGVRELSPTYSDDDVDFAVQAIAGFNVAIATHWDLFTEYKFIAAIDPSFTYSNVYRAGDSEKNEFNYYAQHLITAGVKYNF